MSRITWDEVVQVIEQRRASDAPLLQQMLEVQRRYDGDIAIPLPDLDTSPVIPALTPSLIAETIDNYAIRAASTRPRVECPPLEPMKPRGLGSIEFARIRQKTLYATWYKNRMPLSFRRMYRHISGYATACMVVIPDYLGGFPAMEVRNPLGSYPTPRAPEVMAPVDDCGFVYERSATVLRAKYPECRRENGGAIGTPGSEPEMWEVIEWLDEYQTIIGILGPQDMDCSSYRDARRLGLNPSQYLRSWDNLTGRCPVVTMPRITLNKVASQVAHQLGNIDLQAKLLALAIVAEERAIFPDRFVVGKDGMAPRIISNGGNWADGRSGQTNLLEGVTNVGQLDSAPPTSTGRAIADLERNYRVSTGMNPTFGGETYGSLRTGRGIDSMLGAAVDPRVQEMQEMMEYGMSHANELVLDTWKHCFGDKKHTLFSGWGGVSNVFDLEPHKHIETCDNVVSYAIAGADVQSVTIQLGQLLGTEAISMRTFRNRHPWVEDAEAEEMLLDSEKLKSAVFQSLLQRVMSGEAPMMLVRLIAKYQAQGKDIFEAMDDAEKEMQAKQAQAAPAAPAPGAVGPDGLPLAVAPEGMPGMEGGMELQPPGPAGAIGPAEGSQGLQQLMTAMRQTARAPA